MQNMVVSRKGSEECRDIDAMTEATMAGELCEPACEELTIEIQLRYQDAKRSSETESK